MMNEHIGAASRDITPDFPVPLGGFGQRITPSEGIRDPISVSALCIGQDNPLVIITSDLIASSGAIKQEVVSRIEPLIGITSDRVILTASHTHSAPVPFDPSVEALATAKFADKLVKAIVECVVESYENRRPAILMTTQGNACIGFNRWQPDEEDQVDTRIPIVIALDIHTRQPFAILFGAGCHPTTFGWDNMRISADYPGVAKRLIEQSFPQAIALFVNTTEGDVVPLTSLRMDALDPRGYTGDDEQNSITIGSILAKEVVAVVQKSMQEIDHSEPGQLFLSSFSMELQANSAGLDQEAAEQKFLEAVDELSQYLGPDFQTRISPSKLWSETSRVVIDKELNDNDMRNVMIAGCYYLGLLARKSRGGINPPVTAPIQIAIIDSLQLLFLPGEVLVALAKQWSHLTASNDSFVIGLANTHLRYLPMQQHFVEPGADQRYETVTAGVAPGEIDRVIEESAKRLHLLNL